MTLDLTQYPGGDLKGQTFIDPVIDGFKGDPAKPLVLTNGTFVRAKVTNSTGLTLSGLTIVGDNSGIPVTQITGTSLYMRFCKGVTVERCDISRGRLALQILDSQDCVIDANDIHDNRTDTIRPTNCERLRITRNAMHDWHLAAGDHCDAVQPLNIGLGHDADGVVIEDNICYRGKGSVAQGICFRWYGLPKYANRTGFINTSVARNVLIGMAANGIDLRWPGITGADNDVISFPDVESRILATPEVTLTGNKAKRYAVGGFSNSAPAGNSLNQVVDPSEEAALVAAWSKRVFGSAPAPVPVPVPAPEPAPAPQPVPVPEPAPVDPAPVPVPDTPPVPAVTPLTAEQKAMVLSAVSTALDGVG